MTMPEVSCKTTLNGPAPCVPSPHCRLVGGRTSYILLFPGHPEFRTPLQIPIWGPPWLHPVTAWLSKVGNKGVWIFMCLLRDFGILMARQSAITLNLYNFWINSSFPFYQTLVLRAIIPKGSRQRTIVQKDPRVGERACFGNSILASLTGPFCNNL